ncbi:MAG: ribonuclease HII [Sulfolobaceae archaeon]
MFLGIDEAGRGSLIGPMIVAGVLIDSKSLRVLKNVGVKDSKKLTREKRERLAKIISENSIAYEIVAVQPWEIDIKNLNMLTYEAVNKIVMSMIALKPRIVRIDKVGEEKEVEDLLKKLNIEYQILPKADELFIEVSAASIIAKVFRDWIIDELKKEYGDFGSGYPSDEKTIKWILSIYQKNKDKPPRIIRRSWKILKRICPEYYIKKGEIRDGN